MLPLSGSNSAAERGLLDDDDLANGVELTKRHVVWPHCCAQNGG